MPENGAYALAAYVILGALYLGYSVWLLMRPQKDR